MNLVNQIYSDVKRLEEHVKKSLKKADLMGLVKIGAPDDEYDYEAMLIADLLVHGRCMTSFRKAGKKVTTTVGVRGAKDAVYAVLVESFGRDLVENIPRKKFQAVAVAIMGAKAR